MKMKLLKTMVVIGMIMFTFTACGSEQGSSVNKEEVVEETAAEATEVEESEAEESSETIELDMEAFTNGVIEERTDISLVEMTEGYISGVMNFDLTKVSEYVVCVDASGTTVDEFGIFEANEASGEEVEGMLTEYLEMRVDTWMDEYMPEEKPKVEQAQVINYGKYYIYAILDESEKEQFFMKLEEALVK